LCEVDTRSGGAQPDGVAPPRVIIADDHPVVREGLRVALEAGGLAVVGSAATGRQAAGLACDLRPDVVLMDIRMPDMDGLAATRLIKEKAPEVDVIVVTSYESRDYLARSLEAGASSYLLKDMPVEAIVQAVRAVKAGAAIIHSSLLSRLPFEESAAPASPPARSAPADSLTPHEQCVLRLLMDGLSNKEIAAETGYTLGTVKNIIRRIIAKLGVSDRTQAAIVAVRSGMGEYSTITG
jgi:DNA-binding NarL/FixJ family response regulator